MKQIWTLTRMQLGSALDFIHMGKNKDKKKSANSMVILLLSFALFAFISGAYSFSMGEVMKQMGELNVLPGFFMAVTCMVTLFTSIYKVKGVLFGFKDYDIVMSLPVKASKVVASRLMILYIINFVFTAALMLPCYAVYGYLAKPEPLFYVLAVIAVFFIPLVPMILASIIGVLLAFLTSRFKHSNILGTIVMFAFFIVMMAGSFMINSDQSIANLGTMFRDQMVRLFPLSAWYLDGIINYDIIKYLLYLGISIAAFILFSVVTGKIFKTLNGKISAVHANTKFKMKEMKQNSAVKALYIKEAKRFFSCSAYIFNAGAGLVLMVIGSIAINVIKTEQITVLLTTPEIRTMLTGLCPLLISWMVTMTPITASSISLEGKNLWILTSSPIRSFDILKAKIYFALSVMMPLTVLSSVLFAIALRMNFVSAMITICVPLAYGYFTAVFGILVNLRHPLLDWKSETVVVKNSAAALIGTMSGFLTVGIPTILVFVPLSTSKELINIIAGVVILGAGISIRHKLSVNADRFMKEL